MKKIVCVLCLLFSVALYAGDKEIFKAMNAEIQRAMDNLKITGMNSPYFISLRMQDIKSENIFYASGAEVMSMQYPMRQVQSMVRVGSPEMDNTNFIAGWERAFMNYDQNQPPLNDDMLALRQTFWLAIDAAYKNGLQDFSMKKGYIEKHPQENYPADFLPVPEKTDLVLPSSQPLSIDPLKPYVQEISKHLGAFPFLTQANTNLYLFDIVQYYSDSEGNRHRRPVRFLYLNIYVEAYTEDWYPVGQRIFWIAQTKDDLPTIKEVTAGIDDTVAYLKSLLTQKPLEEYAGPVVFEGAASAVFFLELIGEGTSGAREVLPVEFRDESTGFLAKRFGRKILPASFEIWDKPNEKTFKNHALAGYLPVDDEGVKSQDIQLVSEGKLIGLPMRRTATKKYAVVNGHARGSIFQEIDAAITNLFIEDTDGLPADEFMEEVKAAAEDQDLEEILIVESLRGMGNFGSSQRSSYYANESSLLSNPSRMVLYNVKTGEKRPVWGLEFSSVNERILRDILASTNEPAPYDFPGNQFSISIIAPSILIEEMTLHKTEVQKMRTPSVPMPE